MLSSASVSDFAYPHLMGIGLADTPMMRDSWYYLFALLAAAMLGWLIFVGFVPS